MKKSSPDSTKTVQAITIQPETIKVGVMTIDVSSIGIKFENLMQAG